MKNTIVWIIAIAHLVGMFWLAGVIGAAAAAYFGFTSTFAIFSLKFFALIPASHIVGFIASSLSGIVEGFNNACSARAC